MWKSLMKNKVTANTTKQQAACNKAATTATHPAAASSNNRQRQFLTLLLVVRSDGAEQRAPDNDNGGQRQERSRRDLRLRIRGPEETRKTCSPSGSLELFIEEDACCGITTAAGETEEGGLSPGGSCMPAPGITIKGSTRATMELGELHRTKNAPEKPGDSWRRPAGVHVLSRRHRRRTGPRADVSCRFLRVALQRRPAPPTSWTRKGIQEKMKWRREVVGWSRRKGEGAGVCGHVWCVPARGRCRTAKETHWSMAKGGVKRK